MRWITTITSAALATVLLAAAGAGGAQAANCQTLFTESRSPASLSVTGDTCATARKVSARVAAAAPAGCIIGATRKRAARLRSPCVRLGYTCSATPVKNRKLRVTCSRAARRVRFTY